MHMPFILSQANHILSNENICWGLSWSMFANAQAKSFVFKKFDFKQIHFPCQVSDFLLLFLFFKKLQANLSNNFHEGWRKKIQFKGGNVYIKLRVDNLD